MRFRAGHHHQFDLHAELGADARPCRCPTPAAGGRKCRQPYGGKSVRMAMLMDCAITRPARCLESRLLREQGKGQGRLRSIGVAAWSSSPCAPACGRRMGSWGALAGSPGCGEDAPRGWRGVEGGTGGRAEAASSSRATRQRGQRSFRAHGTPAQVGGRPTGCAGACVAQHARALVAGLRVNGDFAMLGAWRAPHAWWISGQWRAHSVRY